MKKLMIGGVCALTVSLGAWAAGSLYVAPGGDDGASGESWEAPLKTIQRAIELAESGGSIVVSNGVYLIDSPIVLPAGKNIAIRSLAYDYNDVTIDAQGKTHAFEVYSGSVRGLTVQNGVGGAYVSGKPTTYYPGGFYVSGGTIVGCRVCDCHTTIDTDGTADAFGGGISQENGGFSDGVVENCSIRKICRATSVGSCYGGGIFSSGSVENTVVSNCEIYVELPNQPATSVVRAAGGGVLYQGGADLKNLTVVDCKAVCGTDSGAGFGGGVAVFSDNAKLINSKIVGCTASMSGGGVLLRSGGAVVNCLVSNNTVRVCHADGDYNMGAGICCDNYTNKRKTIENSTVCCNSIIDGTAAMVHGHCAGGGAIAIASGSATAPVTVRNCAVWGNLGFNAGAILLYGGKGTVVSNCWFANNKSLRRGGFCYASVNPGALFVDCTIEGHEARWTDGSGQVGQVLTRHCEGGGTDNDIVFRNCFFTKNNPNALDGGLVWMYKGTRPGVSPLTFDRCTFAGNRGDSSYALNISDMFSLTNLTVTGCVFANNGNLALISQSDPNVAHVMTYTYSDNATNLPTNPDYHNKTGVDPKFANRANGDYRLLEGSPLIDAGGAVESWMGEARKSSPSRDMGDGTFAVGPLAGTAYGVSVVRNETKPRLSGDLPDMGCFEFWQKPGVLLFIR